VRTAPHLDDGFGQLSGRKNTNLRMRVARTTATASPESSSVTTSSSTRRASPSSIWPCHQQICVGGLLQEPEVTVAARGQALPQRAAARQLLHVLVRQPGEPVVRSPPPDAGGVLCDGGGGGACSYNLNFIFTAMVNLRARGHSLRVCAFAICTSIAMILSSPSLAPASRPASQQFGQVRRLCPSHWRGLASPH